MLTFSIVVTNSKRLQPMTKPNEFKETYILAADVPYCNTGASSTGPHSSEGMLYRGRVVWLENRPQSAENSKVTAYAEGVGLVVLASGSVEPVR
jgi:hypothetical protein